MCKLLAAFDHRRIFEFETDDDSPMRYGRPLIMKAFEQVPHLEYFAMIHLDHFYKRVGGELVNCG